MAKWIKVSATVDEEFYHGTTTGQNDSILKSVMSSGLDPSLSQGWGQGAGFYVFDNEGKAKNHALVVGDPESEFSIAGNQSTPHGNSPMVLRLPVKYDSSIFDIDYETYPYLAAEMLIALKDLIMTIPDKEISSTFALYSLSVIKPASFCILINSLFMFCFFNVYYKYIEIYFSLCC